MLPWWLRGQSICLQCRRPRFNPWVGRIPWRRKWQPTPVFLPGKSHGQRSLAGYSPWGCQRAGHALLTEPAYMQCIIHTFYCCVKQLKIFLQRKKRHLKEMTQVIPPTGASVIYATSLALSLSCLFHCSYKKQSVNS